MTSLDESLSLFVDSVTDCIRSNKPIMVITHMDCDGLTSGAIAGKALMRAGASCTVRSHTEFSSGLADSLASSERDFCVITDLGGGFAEDLDRYLGERWLILDHHRIPDTEMDNPRVVNAWKFGMDGGTEICAGGMAYLAARALDRDNRDLAPVAVVAAMGDRQDQGEKRALLGKNKEIADAAQEQELLSVDMDLLLYGRETRPLVDALAYTSEPYIKGITWDRASCAALLKQSDIELKDNGRWRVPAELTQKEKTSLVEAIARYAPGSGVTEAVSAMIGYAYTLIGEEEGSFLRDCRQFGTMLNSCGRMGRAGVGIGVCMGDRDLMLNDAESLLQEYRKRIREYISIISNDRWRTVAGTHLVMVNAEDVVPETMTGTIASLIAGDPKHAGKVVILRTGGEQNTVKFSSRKSPGCGTEPSLSELMSRGTQMYGGVGGGHDMAAGARISKDKLDEFLDYLEANVNTSPH